MENKKFFLPLHSQSRRWVRITVSTQDSQSCNRSSILLPSTKKAAASAAAFFIIPVQLKELVYGFFLYFVQRFYNVAEFLEIDAVEIYAADFAIVHCPVIEFASAQIA